MYLCLEFLVWEKMHNQTNCFYIYNSRTVSVIFVVASSLVTELEKFDKWFILLNRLYTVWCDVILRITFKINYLAILYFLVLPGGGWSLESIWGDLLFEVEVGLLRLFWSCWVVSIREEAARSGRLERQEVQTRERKLNKYF